ncbi:TlpA family protein disulfide reductase [Salinivirga cyanobacteriivorans]|nr:TlpA disulfide reductase family protein [Salinivirga cyanobacteriivorans]
MKKLAVIIVGLSIMAGCSKHKHQFKIPINNNTQDTLTAEIYNTWTGLTDSVLNIVPGKQTLVLDTFDLKSIYINKYPEITFFAWDKAHINITQKHIQTDSINEAIIAHQLWTQKIATGETSSKFKWPGNLSNYRYIKGWIKYDDALYGLFNDTTYQIAPNTFSGYRLKSYPAAYMLLHKYTDTTGMWINDYVKHVLEKLNHAGTSTGVEKLFLSLYFKPHKVNLRNDSVLDALSKYKPGVYKELKAYYKKRVQKASIKKGDKFPHLQGTTVNRTKSNIEFNAPYTLIDFWATWCIPCIQQMPTLNKYAKQNKQHFEIISISVDSKKDFPKWLKYAHKHNAINHIWVSDTTNVRKQLGIKGLPHMMLVDASGTIIDPDFPHMSNPLAKKWLSALITKSQTTTASLQPGS